jgi:NAD(P)-dependent dehydrogenase (short-subunit alcohol dehydrogenase family)
MEKIALVTGGTSGLGLITARELARTGARVVFTARDEKKGAAVAEQLRRETGSARIEVLRCDFASLQSIRDAAAEYRRRFDRLHVLVNNAGGVNPKRQLSADGFELTFAVNHLGYFLFTNLLLDILKQSAPSRVVSVASEASRWGSIDFADLQAERRYIGFRQYGASKRMNIAFALELAERLRGTGVTSNALHPGVVASDFGVVSGWFGLGFALMKPFILTPEQGARTQIWLASSPEVEGVTGGYFTRKKQIAPQRQARDAEVRRRLWEVSEELTDWPLPAAPRASRRS